MRLPIFILLILGASGFAADGPTGFVGIPWGASPEEAKRVMQGRRGVIFPENSDDFHIEMTGGTFAGQPVEKWVIEFPERKFASGSVVLKTDGNASTVFKEFRAQLVSKYGSATTDRKLSTATPGTAGLLGSMALWRFAPTMKEKATVVVSAALAGGDGKAVTDPALLTVTIRYVNERLAGPPAGNPVASPKPARPPVKKDDL